MEKTIYRQYCVSEVKPLKEAIKLKCRGNLRTGVLLLQDNEPIHTSLVSVYKAATCGFELRPYSSSSPYLAPFDFFLSS